MKVEEVFPEKCTGCGACELACSFYRDQVFTTMRSSVMLHREELRNYFGVVVKIKDDLILGRPEGKELGSKAKVDKEAAKSKPILMREECDDCGGQEKLCVKFCPTGALGG
jgi:ferredoxin